MFEGIEVQKDALLAPHTTFHVGGPADFLAFPKNSQELLALLREAKSYQMPIYLLAGGSNLLVNDAGVRGLVIQLAGEFAEIAVQSSRAVIPASHPVIPDEDPGSRILSGNWIPAQGRDDNTYDAVRVGAAYSFPKLTRLCLELGWERALGWGGVPGSVGGALKMNAGTRLGEVGEMVVSVEAMTPQGPLTLSHEQMGFSYRNTTFPKEAILCRAYLVCSNPNPEKKSELLGQALELAQRRKQTQPKQRSAGSMFKNPPGDYAGRLIEACGLKGVRVGGAQVSEVHANFLVNDQMATAKDIFELSQIVRKKVYDQFGIELEYEVRRWGF